MASPRRAEEAEAPRLAKGEAEWGCAPTGEEGTVPEAEPSRGATEAAACAA